MRRTALLALVALYIVTWGQNWTTYAGALMIRAVLTHDRTERPPLRKGSA